MATSKKKFYAVRVGAVPGIYESWAECEPFIKGFPKAEYKSFPTKEEAEYYLTGKAPQTEELPPEGTLYAYVDGSYNIESGFYGYGVVLIFPDGHTEEQSGGDKKEEVATMRNVAGELKGAMLAMQYAVNHGFSKVKIFHDYEGIAKWAKGEWKTNLDATAAYREFAWMIQSKITVSFQKVDAHTGVFYNERADILAKQGAGITVE
ncbi:MAG: reverse transcriptase-like protein [Ruminococcaceae bacterium]|nr:reverse transcriptase-like protein [Oscillospiraceae bacterium]